MKFPFRPGVTARFDGFHELLDAALAIRERPAFLGVGAGLLSTGGNLALLTPVSSANGGTGVNNGASTITLAASLATLGTGTLDFTTSGATNTTTASTGGGNPRQKPSSVRGRFTIAALKIGAGPWWRAF